MKEKRDTLTVRIRNQLQQEFQNRETLFKNDQARILAEERTSMEEEIRKFQQHANLVSQKANSDAQAAIQMIKEEAERFIQESKTNMNNELQKKEQQFLERLHEVEEDMDTLRRGSKDYAEALQKTQVEAKKARRQADEARAEAEMMRLKLIKANTGHRLTDVCIGFVEGLMLIWLDRSKDTQTRLAGRREKPYNLN